MLSWTFRHPAPENYPALVDAIIWLSSPALTPISLQPITTLLDSTRHLILPSASSIAAAFKYLTIALLDPVSRLRHVVLLYSCFDVKHTAIEPIQAV